MSSWISAPQILVLLMLHIFTWPDMGGCQNPHRDIFAYVFQDPSMYASGSMVDFKHRITVTKMQQLFLPVSTIFRLFEEVGLSYAPCLSRTNHECFKQIDAWLPDYCIWVIQNWNESIRYFVCNYLIAFLGCVHLIHEYCTVYIIKCITNILNLMRIL